MTQPYDHMDIGLHLLEYLASVGACADPHQEQDGSGDAPATFLGIIDDHPNRAIGLLGPWVENDSTSNPMIRFMIVGRGQPGNQRMVTHDMERIYRALWSEYGVELTATRAVAYCDRVQVDPPIMPDDNGRYRRVDTYQARVKVPTN